MRQNGVNFRGVIATMRIVTRGIPVLVAILLSCCASGSGPKESVPRLPPGREEIATSNQSPVDGKSREAPRISAIQLEDLFQLREEGSVLLVDVRPAFFFRLGHIPGAYNLPLKTFDTGVNSFLQNLEGARSSGRKIVIYCADLNCPDSLTTARKLARMGYSTSVYRGGWKEWRSAGL